MENGLQMTFAMLEEETSPALTCGALAAPVNHSVSRDSEKDSTESLALFERSLECCKKSQGKIDPSGLSTRMWGGDALLNKGMGLFRNTL